MVQGRLEKKKKKKQKTTIRYNCNDNDTIGWCSLILHALCIHTHRAKITQTFTFKHKKEKHLMGLVKERE